LQRRCGAHVVPRGRHHAVEEVRGHHVIRACTTEGGGELRGIVTSIATVVAAREVIGMARDRGRVTGDEIREVVVNNTAFGSH
jgi:hypothetical protein